MERKRRTSVQVDIGRRVAIWREARMLTPRQLAAACGMSQPSIQRIELGKQMPSGGALDKICDALDITLGELIAGRDNPDLTASEEPPAAA